MDNISLILTIQYFAFHDLINLYCHHFLKQIAYFLAQKYPIL